MIEINLLPEDRRKKQERFKGIDFSQFKLQHTAILGIIGSVSGALLAAYVAMIATGFFFKSDLKNLEKQYEKVAVEKKEADLLRAEVSLINKKVKAIDELMVNRFSWAKKLDELNECMIPGVWLSEISYDDRPGPAPGGKAARPAAQRASPRTISLAGYALNSSEEGNATIGKFIRSLKNNGDFFSDFSDIQLQYTKLEKILDQDVVNFRMVCFFSEKAK